MMYYRVAIRGIQGGHAASWRWKSPLFNSLHNVLGVLNLYRAVSEERMRIFLCTSIQPMDTMLERANQGRMSTAITVQRLWDAHSVNWIEIRRLEVELGEGSDHNQPYDPYDRDRTLFDMQTLAWTTLRARRARGELLS